MPRISRKDNSSPYLHVVVQGIGKESIFATNSLKSAYLDDLARFKDDYDVKIITYCIMINHAHILLRTPSVEAVIAFMHRVNTRFAGWYNKVNDRVGYVFRNRYLSQPIFDDRYVINCLVYIHNNPVKVGLVQNAADYLFSGLRCYLDGEGIVDLDCAAELFDVSPQNLLAIMSEKSEHEDGLCPIWLDHKESPAARDAGIANILKNARCNLSVIKHDKEELCRIIDILRENNITLAEAARHLGISRSTIYNALTGK